MSSFAFKWVEEAPHGSSSLDTLRDRAKSVNWFFTERLAPAYDAAGLSMAGIERTVFDLHTLAAGDLTGTPIAV